MTIHIYTDGGSRGNPGPAASGVYIADDTGHVLDRLGIVLGITTNNVAEYTAVIEGFRWLIKQREKIGNPSAIHFFMDSKLVCSQMKGLFRVKHPNMIPLFQQAKLLEKELHLPVTYTHIPREKNKEADAMVNKALDNLL